jgi:pyruvate/2-oxoglutarate dehydrogenase complex dihydrolipoamide acyltransferase (E2) component
VKEGDTVKSGDLMAEIETDKATMEFEAVDEGVIGKILVAEGTDGVKVGTVIAVLLEEGEAPAARTRTATAPKGPKRSQGGGAAPEAPKPRPPKPARCVAAPPHQATA